MLNCKPPRKPYPALASYIVIEQNSTWQFEATTTVIKNITLNTSSQRKFRHSVNEGVVKNIGCSAIHWFISDV